MKVIVVRHAIAEERDVARFPDDGMRPLTSRGRKRFARAARGLKRLVPRADLVFSSPYKRAWDTAVLLHEHAGWPEPEACNELQHSPPEDVMRVLEPLRDLDTVVMVGHEPHLGRLVAHLLAPSVRLNIELRRGGAAAVDLSVEGARLLWMLQPRALRLIA